MQTAFSQSVCFAAAPVATEGLLPVRLAPRHASALAELLPMLLCGEESAALVFGRITGQQQLDHAAREALLGIHDDELQHQVLLNRLRASLPEWQPPDDTLVATRRFFRSMEDRDPGRHLARIAALDSAVCILLGALRQHSPVARDAATQEVLQRIHVDEARHVVVSRRYALLLGNPGSMRDIAQATRHALAALLEYGAAALERLELDPARVLRRVQQVPKGLFA